MSSLKSILLTYRAKSQTEREKGSYFEELIGTYFQNEPRFQAGRDLAHWHLNCETVAYHPGVAVQVGKEEGPYCPSTSAKANAEEATVRSPLLKPDAFRVTKMKFAKKKDPETGKSVNEKTTVICNGVITLRNIPLAANDYLINGKPALEWVMERQSVTTDKDSGIIKDANLWATETMGNSKYPLELFPRVVTVGWRR